MQVKRHVVRAVSIFLLSSVALSTEIETYEEGRELDFAAVRAYVNGVGEGYSWANANLISRSLPPLYCEPRGITMTPERYLSILDHSIELWKSATPESAPIELLLLQGLQFEFPCPDER